LNIPHNTIQLFEGVTDKTSLPLTMELHTQQTQNDSIVIKHPENNSEWIMSTVAVDCRETQ